MTKKNRCLMLFSAVIMSTTIVNSKELPTNNTVNEKAHASAADRWATFRAQYSAETGSTAAHVVPAKIHKNQSLKTKSSNSRWSEFRMEQSTLQTTPTRGRNPQFVTNKKQIAPAKEKTWASLHRIESDHPDEE